MICLIALFVFGVLGIFSVRYRIIAKEALDCVFRRVTLRKCTTGLDKRLKSQITGKLMRKSPKFGGWIYKNFEIISWFFTILLILSIIQSGISAYNFIAYGNCNGKGSDEFCIFDPFGTGVNEREANASCSVTGSMPDFPLLKPNIGSSPYYGNTGSDLVIVEFGCYSCGYTIKSEEVMKQIREEYGNDYLFVFKHFPIPSHELSYMSAIAAECARRQDKFWDYHDKLFSYYGQFTNQTFLDIANELSLDMDAFSQCLINKETKDEVDADIDEGKRIGIYGTPTVFVNDDYLVGQHAFREYKSLIRKND